MTKGIAESLVRKYKTRDPFRIAKSRGYVIIRCPLSGIRGFYQHLQRRYVIYIRNKSVLVFRMTNPVTVCSLCRIGTWTVRIISAGGISLFCLQCPVHISM